MTDHSNPFLWQEHLFGLPPERWSALCGRSFWVTGAGTGYGRAMAVALAAAGGQVFLTGRRRGRLDETIYEIEGLGISPERCHLLPVDITDFDQARQACRGLEGKCEALYGLVNNAALPARGDVSWPLLESSAEDWNRMMATNVTAPWFLTRTIFPHMAKGKAARVLMVSSGAGWAFTPGFGPYNVSKAALNNLGASMAAECAAKYPDLDVQINVLVPGEARTEMNQGSDRSPFSIVRMALLLLSHPAGGPNGRFFHSEGGCLSFCTASAYDKSIV